jgi:protein phosphatase
VHRLVLRELLNPRQWRAPEDRKFHLDAEQINELCDAAERIFKDEPSVLRLRGEAF